MNLLPSAWTQLDPWELRVLLEKHLGGPGQYHDRPKRPNKLFLPLADESCQVVLTFRRNSLRAIEPGPAFKVNEWSSIVAEIQDALLAGPVKVGREYSFSSYRVSGSWRGERSGAQISPPPPHAPVAPVEMAEHPFVLEFPLKTSRIWPVTNHRRIREHRRLTLLLNVLLAGRSSFQARRAEHCWAVVGWDGSVASVDWVQQSFLVGLGPAVIDALSPSADSLLPVIPPTEYELIRGYDGLGLRAPSDLDESICRYYALSQRDRAKFDRAAFWLDMAQRQWSISVSSSFAALVSAVESLTERGPRHAFDCPVCGQPTHHEVPGPTRLFKRFLETYAPGAASARQRDDMYSLRSTILHGDGLMLLDDEQPFGWDPAWLNQQELYGAMSTITRMAMRNWLRNPAVPPTVASSCPP